MFIPDEYLEKLQQQHNSTYVDHLSISTVNLTFFLIRSSNIFFFTFTFNLDLHKFTLRNNLTLIIENEGLVMSNSQIQKFDFKA